RLTLVTSPVCTRFTYPFFRDFIASLENYLEELRILSRPLIEVAGFRSQETSLNSVLSGGGGSPTLASPMHTDGDDDDADDIDKDNGEDTVVQAPSGVGGYVWHMKTNEWVPIHSLKEDAWKDIESRRVLNCLQYVQSLTIVGPCSALWLAPLADTN